MRFPLRTTWWSRLALAPFLVGREATVELDEHGVHVQLGRLFDERLAYDAVEAVSVERWPWIGGVGIRIGMGKDVGVISSTGSVVRIRLRRPVRVPIAFGLGKEASSLLVSVEAPEQLVTALQDKTRGVAA